MDVNLYVDVFFFFKQKTAYEMRISDWSSDVCSSDLVEEAVEPPYFQRRLRVLGDQAHRHRMMDVQIFDDARRLGHHAHALAQQRKLADRPKPHPLIPRRVSRPKHPQPQWNADLVDRREPYLPLRRDGLLQKIHSPDFTSRSKTKT